MTAADRLERAVRKAQADFRAPALSVALHRPDRELWTCTVGTSGNPGHPLDADSRFRIGSVTKTFTAVLVMQARDDGLLDLDDRSASISTCPRTATRRSAGCSRTRPVSSASRTATSGTR